MRYLGNFCQNYSRHTFNLNIKGIKFFLTLYSYWSKLDRTATKTENIFCTVTIEIIDIECVLGHESCLHFFRKCPFKTAMLNLTRSRTAELYYRKFIINRSLNITFTV